MNKLELSPLTPRGLARRLLDDIDHARSENVLVALVSYVRALSEDRPGYRLRLPAAEALLRGLAVTAKPGERSDS
jgi:hypothetical protein